jgi:predicted RNA-binding protein with PIN domain
VRVLFSDPGVLADDVIRDLVAAEPHGRPLVVATSDRAVVQSVRRRGAHAVPSAVLLARLVRG